MDVTLSQFKTFKSTLFKKYYSDSVDIFFKFNISKMISNPNEEEQQEIILSFFILYEDHSTFDSLSHKYFDQVIEVVAQSKSLIKSIANQLMFSSNLKHQLRFLLHPKILIQYKIIPHYLAILSNSNRNLLEKEELSKTMISYPSFKKNLLKELDFMNQSLFTAFNNLSLLDTHNTVQKPPKKHLVLPYLCAKIMFFDYLRKDYLNAKELGCVSKDWLSILMKFNSAYKPLSLKYDLECLSGKNSPFRKGFTSCYTSQLLEIPYNQMDILFPATKLIVDQVFDLNQIELQKRDITEIVSIEEFEFLEFQVFKKMITTTPEAFRTIKRLSFNFKMSENDMRDTFFLLKEQLLNFKYISIKFISNELELDNDDIQLNDSMPLNQKIIEILRNPLLSLIDTFELEAYNSIGQKLVSIHLDGEHRNISLYYKFLDNHPVETRLFDTFTHIDFIYSDKLIKASNICEKKLIRIFPSVQNRTVTFKYFNTQFLIKCMNNKPLKDSKNVKIFYLSFEDEIRKIKSDYTQLVELFNSNYPNITLIK